MKYETTGVTGVFTEQFMASPNSYLLRNERKTLANIYIECARMQSCFWLLQTLLVAALPPSLFYIEFFLFLGLTNSQDLLTHSLILVLTRVATTVPGG